MSDTVGQSYNEQILQSIIDGEPYDDPNPYPSRIETLLLELKEVIESGGDPELAQRVSAIEAQLFSTIANVATNTDSGSMDLYSKDLNTITTSGFYNAMTCTNAPANYCTLIVTGYYLTGYCTQIAMDVATGTFYTRTQSNGTWGSWIEKANTADLGAAASKNVDTTPTASSTNLVESGGVYTALSGKQDTLTTAQQNAVDSGIDSAKVEQIATNTTAISTKADKSQVFDAGTKLATNTDLDSVTTHGLYHTDTQALTNSLSNCPVTNTLLTLKVSFGTNTILQELQPVGNEQVVNRYVRTYGSGVWTEWYDTFNDIYGLGTSIPSNANLDNYITKGVFYTENADVSASLANNPDTAHPFRLEVKYMHASSRTLQILTPTNFIGGVFYQRLRTSGGWQPWYKFEGTAVT